jgi:hypothetical protein
VPELGRGFWARALWLWLDEVRWGKGKGKGKGRVGEWESGWLDGEEEEEEEEEETRGFVPRSVSGIFARQRRGLAAGMHYSRP